MNKVKVVARAKRVFLISGALIIGLMINSNNLWAQAKPIELGEDLNQTVYSFVSLLLLPDQQLTTPMNYIERTWQPSYVSMALDVLSINRRSGVRTWLLGLLRKRTGQHISNDLNDWYSWMWNQPEQKYSQYGEFKSVMFGLVDKKFRGYFSNDRQTAIRMDEVRWGGVGQDGIPPLRGPRMISADEADYLEDDHKVFGIEINGYARAYPNRILAWHEMFVDSVGGVALAGVYCTLCGAVILYQTEYQGINYQMGTSGFLFRSNKLMYDQKTQSLWSTTLGEPVIGPLVGKGIRLQRSFVVTTTWGEWKRRHPESMVLSLHTGYARNYDEGVAYHEYFATDELMFNVPKLDNRLKNKDEVLALTYPQQSDQKLAIHEKYLSNNPIYHDQVGDIRLVVLTDKSGANRVFQSDEVQLSEFDQKQTATDTQGNSWSMSEQGLTSMDGRILPRLPAHRAFWFGWYAVHNDTRLVF